MVVVRELVSRSRTVKTLRLGGHRVVVGIVMNGARTLTRLVGLRLVNN